MGIFSWLWDKAKSFVNGVVSFIKSVIRAVLSFFNDVVNWFKNKYLVQGRDIPFISRGEQLRDILHSSNTRKVDAGIFSSNNQVMKAVYNDQTDEITDMEIVGADSLDQQTRAAFANDDLVVLT